MDLKCQLVDLFHWSLKEIDETDIESLLPFIFYYPQWKQRAQRQEQVKTLYADQVNWI